MSSFTLDHMQFKSACSKFPTGVTVTTLFGRDRNPYGLTISSFASVSLNPPLVLVCVDNRSRFRQHLEVGGLFGINVLSEDQQELSIQFSRNWDERFSNVPWYVGQTGVPLLLNVMATFECAVTDLIPAGDHVIVLGEVQCATTRA